MFLKFLILGFLGLLSVVSPPVFAGIILLCLVSVTVCNLEITFEKFSKSVARQYRAKPFKIPCNFLAIGMLLIGAFTMAGVAWGENPHFAEDTLSVVGTLMFIGLQFASLMILVASMGKFVKLVD
ncbi:MAG: hypothetical protein SGJ27_02780 [Candidatus Melainabacteria bacterium]|nr:hypothetical protein [Candidatus Melainabacteria bacterium]